MSSTFAGDTRRVGRGCREGRGRCRSGGLRRSISIDWSFLAFLLRINFWLFLVDRDFCHLAIRGQYFARRQARVGRNEGSLILLRTLGNRQLAKQRLRRQSSNAAPVIKTRRTRLFKVERRRHRTVACKLSSYDSYSCWSPLESNRTKPSCFNLKSK